MASFQRRLLRGRAENDTRSPGLQQPLGANLTDLGSRWADYPGLVVMSVLGAVPLVPRWFEFPALHVSWDSNA